MPTTDKTFKGGLPTLTLVGAITAIAPGAGATLDTSGTATNWPNGSGSHSFVIVIDSEAILISARTGNQFTVEARGHDNTTPASHGNGVEIKHELDAATILAHEQHVVKTSGAHAATAISYAGYDGTGTINDSTATDVEGALDELYAQKIDKDVMTARGSVPYFGASGWAELAAGAQRKMLRMGGTDPQWDALPVVLAIPVSDEATALTTGTAKVSFRMPFQMTLSSVRASVGTVSSSGIPTVNIKEEGTTIFSTKLTIDANEKSSTTAATAAVLSDTSLADDAEITIDIDVAGTGTKGLKVYFIGTTVSL